MDAGNNDTVRTARTCFGVAVLCMNMHESSSAITLVLCQRKRLIVWFCFLSVFEASKRDRDKEFLLGNMANG